MKKTCLALLLALALLLSALPGLAEVPQRIVALPVWAAEMLLPMVGPERLIGISAYMDNDAVTYAAEAAAAVEHRVASNNAEGIVMLAPDLVILDTFSDWDGSLTKTLSEAGIPIELLESPTDFESIMHRITDLGEATGSPSEATAMVEDMEARLNALAEKVAPLTDEERVTVMFYEDYYDQSGSSAGTLAAYGPGSTFDTLAQTAGLINVCDAENYSAVSKEKVVAEWKPAVLIVPSTAYGADFVAYDDGGKTLIDSILADETLGALPAVQAGQVYAIDDRARASTSQYMVQGAEDLAKLCYPELFE